VNRYEDVRYVARRPELFSATDRTIRSSPDERPTTASVVKVHLMLESDPPDSAVHRRQSIAPFRPVAGQFSKPSIVSIH
jgi:cytochrome P450